MSDAYAIWRARLKDPATVNLPPHLPTVYPSDTYENPQPGLWRRRMVKGGPYELIRIWLQDDIGSHVHAWRDGLTLCGSIGQKPATADKLCDVWIGCEPVSKTAVEYYTEHGRWEGEAPTIGDNSCDLSLAEQITEYAKQALGWLKKHGVKTKTDSDKAANYRAELLKLAKEADAARDAEKRPHLEAGRAIDAKYKPLVDEAKTAADVIRDELTAFMTAEKRRLEAEARAKYEAERAAAEAARKEIEAQRARQMRDDPIAALTSPEPELPMPPPPPEPIKVQSGGQRGRKTGLRQVTSYVVTDHAAALAFFADSNDVRELVAKLAERASKAGVSVPGVEKQIHEVAA